MKPKARLKARHPTVREHAKTVARFSKACARLGLSREEGLRQLIASYLAYPHAIKPGRYGEQRDAILGSPSDTQANVAALAAQAKRNGVSTSEVIRQLVAKYLNEVR